MKEVKVFRLCKSWKCDCEGNIPWHRAVQSLESKKG